MAILNFPRSRSLGNAQSRNPALGNAPIYGMNPTGAQTSTQGFSYDPQGRLTGVPSALQSVAPTMSNPMPQGAFSPPIEQPYAGGDVVGASQAMREAGLKTYHQNKSALGGTIPQVPQAQFGAMAGGQMIPREPMSPAQQAEWARAQRESALGGGGSLPAGFGLNATSMPQAGAFGGGPPLQSFGNKNPQNGVLPELALAGRIDALTAASQAANPLVPNSPIAQPQQINPPAVQAQIDRMAAQEAARQQNNYNGNVAFVNDPNRVTADQAYQIAQQSAAARAAGGAAGDPTGLNRRFGAGSALGQSAAAYQRGLTGEARGEGVFIQPGGYGSPKVYEQFNNTPEGALEVAQAKAKARPAEQAAYSALAKSENARRDREIGSERAAARVSRRAEQKAFLNENGGINKSALNREKRRLERVFNRDIKAGRITREAATAAVDERMAEFKEGKKSALAGGPVAVAPPDRVRLPNGQLPQPTRIKAAETAKNLTDPQYAGGSPQFQKEREILATVGVTHTDNPHDAASKIFSGNLFNQTGEALKQSLLAVRRYFGSMLDSDAEWEKSTGPWYNPQKDASGKIALLKEMSQIPENELQTWYEQNAVRFQKEVDNQAPRLYR